MVGSLERLGVDLVHIFGPRRTGREPPGRGRHLEAADGGAVAGGGGQLANDRLAGKLGGGYLLRAQLGENRLFLSGGGRVEAGVDRAAEAVGEGPVALTRRISLSQQ